MYILIKSMIYDISRYDKSATHISKYVKNYKLPFTSNKHVFSIDLLNVYI